MFRYALAAAGACLVLGAAAVPSIAPGITFTMRSSSEGSSAQQVTKVRFLDGVIRFDMEQAKDAKQGSPQAGVGFVLVNAKARSMAMVMPEMKRYMEIKFDSTAGMVFQAMAMNSYVTDISVSGDALGSGGIVNGVPTKRYRITMSYKTADNSSADRASMRSVKSVEEFWVTEQLKDFPDPTEAFARALGGVGQKTQMPTFAGVGGAADLMRQRAQTQQRLFNGLPVRTKWTQTEEFQGETKTSSGQNDITDIQKVDLDPADFRIPEGYAKFDMQSLEGMKAGFRDALRANRGASSAAQAGAKKDTTSLLDDAKGAVKDAAKETADEVKQETKESVKDAAKDAAKDAIKGKIFGRLKKP